VDVFSLGDPWDPWDENSLWPTGPVALRNRPERAAAGSLEDVSQVRGVDVDSPQSIQQPADGGRPALRLPPAHQAGQRLPLGAVRMVGAATEQGPRGQAQVQQERLPLGAQEGRQAGQLPVRGDPPQDGLRDAPLVCGDKRRRMSEVSLNTMKISKALSFQ